ncbi:MAG: ABC transporter ATP-binding protein, partial [Rhodothermales bacterium]
MTDVKAFAGRHLRRVVDQLPLLPRALALVWASSRNWTIIWFGVLLVSGILPAALVYLTRLVVDSLVAVLGAGGAWETLRPAAIWAALMAGLMLLDLLLRSLSNYIKTVQAEHLKDHVSQLIHAQSVNVDLAFYDASDYYDHLYRARNAAGHRPLLILENIGGLLQHGITLLAMAWILLPYGWWLPLVLLVSTLPAFYVALYHKARLHRWRRGTTTHERRTWYYDWLLTDRDNAAEIRLFDLAATIQQAYRQLRERLRGEKLALAKDQGKAEVSANLSALVVTGGVMAWMIWRAGTGTSTLGDVALFYQAFNRGQGIMRALMGNLGDVYTNSLFLSDLFEFLELKPSVHDPENPVEAPRRLEEGIVFENVGFKYAGGGRQVLEDFNLKLEAGQVAAIVGPNGAGKTTLVKLLCRLYDPSAGRISIDGVDIRRFSLADLRREITVLFQDPVDYHDTAAQNI